MTTPLISVIIPVYNNELYLRQCLDSLINQTLKDIEIICINDGSTDNSLNILKEYSMNDSRIIVINQPNKGQSAARNAGIKIAKGEYIGFIDSDDWANISMFEKLYKNAKQYDSDIAMCSITIFDEESNEYNSNDSYMTLDLFPSSFENRAFSTSETFDFIFRICVTPWNKIYKTDFIQKNNIKFVEGLNYEDTVFCINTLLNAQKLSILKENLVYYRKNSATSYSFSHKHDAKKLDFFKILELEEKIIKKKNLWNTLKKGFEIHKLGVLKYWKDKISDKKIKFYYVLLSYIKNPSIIFSPITNITHRIIVLNLLKKFKGKKIIFWGASLYLQKLLKYPVTKQLQIQAIVDTNKAVNYKELYGYKLILPEQIKDIEAEYIIPTVPNIYNFNKYVISYLNEKNIKISVINIFNSRLPNFIP